MLYSYNWLKELSGTKKSVHELVDLFTVHSFEVEGTQDLARGLEKVVIGKVLTKTKHPNADRLHVTTVDVGAQEPLTIVCGAPNVAAGQKVAVALAGATLPTGVAITKSTIRGQESQGMICAEDELGIGKNHDGIIVLPDDAPVGEHFAVYTGRNDTVIDIKILPNRGHDCLSHIGIAHEIRALEGGCAMSLDEAMPSATAIYDATVTTENCRRYGAVVLDDITNTTTPQWMRNRLRTCGIKPINAVVDITNYVMLETGQPLHAFDATRVRKIVVRHAQAGETLTLLDDTVCTLTADDLVITDGKKPIALAGVMGGKESGITEDTTTLVLESASFDAPTIRAMQRRYGLLTDAAFRFERDLDPNVAAYAATRAVALLTDICGARVVAATDIYPAPVSPWTVPLALSAVHSLLGTTIAAKDITTILTRLGMDVTHGKKQDTLIVTVPTVRRDLTTQEDLIEEIGRLYGYDKITPTPLCEAIITPEINTLRRAEHAAMDICIADGFDEVKSYAYYAAGDADAIGIATKDHVTVLNPLAPDYVLMRRSLLPGLCRAVKKNLSYFSDVHICEIGRIYNPADAVLPEEHLRLGAAIASRATDGSQFYELKGVAEHLAARCGMGTIICDADIEMSAMTVPLLHATRRAVVRTQAGDTFGWIGEITTHTQKFYGIKNVRVAVMELAIDMLTITDTHIPLFTPLPKYPTAARDLSMALPSRMQVATVTAQIADVGGALLRDVTVFDVYYNRATEERSMACRMTFGADDRTLLTEEVDAAMASITAHLDKMPGITLRVST